MPHNSKSYTVIIDQGASARMQEHLEFLARVNVAAAESLLSDLMGVLRRLEIEPQGGLAYNRPFIPAGKYRYILVKQRYRVVYTIEDAKVYVDDIQDARQSQSRNLT
jgi:plasmid stabilization system protein ParE